METPVTESNSLHNNLENLSIEHLTKGISSEDHKVAVSIEKELAAINKLIEAATEHMKNGGRLFYLGAGTSGRLGIVDASECPPTFGVPHGMVIGIIAGGDTAVRKAVEFAEDDTEQGWKDLTAHHVNPKDFVVGISASGRTPYVAGALLKAKENGIKTGCIVCNKGSKIGDISDYAIEVELGPEFITGSTRMKAGTAQKLILNMVSTVSMIKLGRVVGNKMVDMQLSNNKLIERGTKMVMEKTSLNEEAAKAMLLKHGSVRNAIKAFQDQ